MDPTETVRLENELLGVTRCRFFCRRCIKSEEEKEFVYGWVICDSYKQKGYFCNLQCMVAGYLP